MSTHFEMRVRAYCFMDGKAFYRPEDDVDGDGPWVEIPDQVYALINDVDRGPPGLLRLIFVEAS